MGGFSVHSCDKTACNSNGPATEAPAPEEPTNPITENGDCPNQADYCTLGDDNTMCKYCGIGATCNDQVINNEMTESMKQELLDKHNELRARVANGEEAGQPSATNMNKLIWDDELASNAQLWVDQCPDGSWVVSDAPPHDPNRLTIKYDGAVGQNMADSWNSQDNMNWGLSKKVQDWYDEVKDWPAANVGAFSQAGATGVIGHYTQVVWAETKYVGCGVIYYRDQADWAASYPYRKVLLAFSFILQSIEKMFLFSPLLATTILLVIGEENLFMRPAQQLLHVANPKMDFAFEKLEIYFMQLMK